MTIIGFLKRQKSLYAAVCAVLAALAFLAPVRVPDLETAQAIAGSSHIVAVAIAKWSIATDGLGITGAVLACFFFVFYRKIWFAEGEKKERPIHVSTLLFSFSLSVCILIGISFNAFDNLSFLIGNGFQIAFAFLLLLGYVPFFYTLAELAFAYMDKAMAVKKEPQKDWIAAFLVDRRPFAIPFTACLVAWLPYWIIYFPGNIEWDFLVQLNYYFGVWQWSDHHPIFGSFLFGFLMQLGRSIYNDNLGVFFVILLNHLIIAFSCAYASTVMKRWQVPRAIRLGALIFWMFNPLIAFWMPTAIKDTPAMGLLFLFCILFLDLIKKLKDQQPYAKLMAITVLVGIISALLRNHFTAAGSLILLILLKQPLKQRLSCLVAGVLCITVTSLISNTLVSALDATPKSLGEALSIPFQQTARYLREHPNDVTAGERDAIEAVLDYTILTEKYNPKISDPVKATYRNTPEALPEYFKVWFAMFKRHPMTYMEATLANSYAYFCPVEETNSVYPLVSYGSVQDKSVNTGYFETSYIFSSSAARSQVYSLLTAVKNLPGINLFFGIGNYTWFTLFLMLGLFQKKRYNFMLGFCPTLLTILTCMASPVNGHFRYFLPSLIMVPLLLAWAVSGAYPEPKTDA